MVNQIETGVNGNGKKGQSALERFAEQGSRDSGVVSTGLESDLCKPNFNYTNPNRSSPLNLEPRIHTSYYNTEPKPEVKKKPLLKRLGKLAAVSAITLATLAGVGLVADYNGAFIKSDKEFMTFTDISGRKGSITSVEYLYSSFFNSDYKPSGFKIVYENGEIKDSATIKLGDGRIILVKPDRCAAYRNGILTFDSKNSFGDYSRANPGFFKNFRDD